MSLSYFLVITVVSIVRSCATKATIVAPQSSGTYELVQATENILTSCYANRGNAVGLAGSLPEVLLREIWTHQSLPVILIDDITVINRPVPRKFRRKLETFVVMSSAPRDLKKIFKRLQTSVWWNHLASFVIVDWESSSSGRGCSSARDLLWASWEMELLDAKLLCLDRTRGTLIYTFNPFTNHAPSSWQSVGTFKGDNEHPWTLLLQEYRPGPQICRILNFDKTKDLGGYEIKTSMICDSMRLGKYGLGVPCLSPLQAVTVQLLFPAMKAKCKPLIHHSFDFVGYVDDKGNPNGIMAEVANEISDFSLVVRYQMILLNFTTTYPHWYSGLYAMTQYNGYTAPLEKVLGLLDTKTRICFYLVCFSALMFFKFFQRQPLMAAALNLLRIFGNTALCKLPKGLPSRIYLGSLFLFMLHISGLYQGKLATLLTKQSPLPNVNTAEDLQDLRYTIYGTREFASFFKDPGFQDRYVARVNPECADRVLANKTAACIQERFFLIHDAAKFTLHVSRSPIVNLNWVHQIRENWSLERRINVVLQRFVEADLMRPLHARESLTALRILEINESDQELFENLSVDALKFSFMILLIGLSFATAAFLGELGIRRPEKFHLQKQRHSFSASKIHCT